jgi:uncharacterized membrane-anchored protein
MRFRIILGICIIALSSFVYASNADVTSPEEQEYLRWAGEMWESLERTTGTVELAEAGAKLNVPEEFYYLNPADAEKVLVEVWGNPPGQNTLGMLFPSEMTPFDGSSWAVTIEYEEDGYVSDKDADDIDYTQLLTQMKNDTRSASEERVKQGYDSIQLVGWAATPYYDSAAKKLHWAKEIKFGSQAVNTLNYNIRVLGRKGVLVLNFIADIDQKPTIDANLDTVLALAEFEQGYKYNEFNPGIDKVATYGLGALVAGKIIAKTGFFVVALMALKKFGIVIILGFGVLIKRLFSRAKA